LVLIDSLLARPSATAEANRQVISQVWGLWGPSVENPQNGTPRREKEHPDTSLAILVFTTHRTAYYMQPEHRNVLVL